MKVSWRRSVAHFTFDPCGWHKRAAASALALLCILAIDWSQRNGLLDRWNIEGMALAGAGRDQAPAVTLLMTAASMIGDNLARFLIVALVGLALFWAGKRRMALWLAIVVAGGSLLNFSLKQLFAAPRPGLLPHLDIVHSYSFPSGHSAGNMILYGAMALLAGRGVGYVAAGLMVLLIGVSRVWLGVHWPSDVVAGWIEGVGWLAFCAHWKPRGVGQGSVLSA